MANPTARQAGAEYSVPIKEAAARIGCSRITLLRRVRSERIPHARRGWGKQRQQIWFHPDEVARLARQTCRILNQETNQRAETAPRDDPEGRALEAPACPTEPHIESVDAMTNPRIAEVAAAQPDLFAGWDGWDWRELYSLHGVGGPLTQEGVAQAAARIKWKRQVRRQFEAVLETVNAQPLAAVIQAFYQTTVQPDAFTPARQSVTDRSLPQE